MKCPKCGYISLDFHRECPKCRKDLSEQRTLLKLADFRPDPPALLGALLEQTKEPRDDVAPHPFQQDSSTMAMGKAAWSGASPPAEDETLPDDDFRWDASIEDMNAALEGEAQNSAAESPWGAAPRPIKAKMTETVPESFGADDGVGVFGRAADLDDLIAEEEASVVSAPEPERTNPKRQR